MRGRIYVAGPYSKGDVAVKLEKKDKKPQNLEPVLNAAAGQKGG
jgi:hypothetical protein